MATLTPDDIQMIADHTESLIFESEKRQEKKYASREEMKVLIRDTVGQVVEEKIVEKIGNLPTREEFFSRMDTAVGKEKKNEQELLLLSHQYKRQDRRIDALEEDLENVKKKKKSV